MTIRTELRTGDELPAEPIPSKKNCDALTEGVMRFRRTLKSLRLEPSNMIVTLPYGEWMKMGHILSAERPDALTTFTHVGPYEFQICGISFRPEMKR